MTTITTMRLPHHPLGALSRKARTRGLPRTALVKQVLEAFVKGEEATPPAEPDPLA
jgi:predicted DNA binding CopG/RHH family protein